MTTNPGKIINLKKLPSYLYLEFTVFYSLTGNDDYTSQIMML